jgi:two-component system OmpR family sensor kinase
VSIRLRLALGFAITAAALFTVGAWLFAATLSTAQLRVIDSQLGAQLATAARYVPGTALPAVAAVPGDYLVQVVDAAGQVAGRSPDAGTVPLLSPGQLDQARHFPVSVTTAAGKDEAESLRVTGAPMTGHPGWVALAAISLETYNTTQNQVTRGLAVGGTVFTVVAGVGAYWLARAALSPVERLRRQAAAISVRDGDPAALQVPRTRDEIAALAGTMNNLLGRLRRALDTERAFVADASHELRSPLAVLRGELELAARPGRSPAELTAAVHTAAEEADRLARITSDLLVLARGDAGRLELRLAETDLRDLLGRSAALARTRLSAAGVTCRVDVPAGARAHVDPDRVRQAVDNLLANAARFAPAGSVIVVTATEDGPDLRIEVSDDGPGLPDAFLPHAFERFRRPDGGRSRDDGGAGLGLAIVAAICAAHGGQATARNKTGGGAVVSMRFPGAIRATRARC